MGVTIRQLLNALKNQLFWGWFLHQSFSVKVLWWGYGQDGDVGRNALLPCTTKRITTNLKTINNQKCQKIKLHRTLTTKGLKKHLPRPVGGVELGREVMQQGVGPHRRGRAGWEDSWWGCGLCRQGRLAEWETKDSKLSVNDCGVATAGETPSLIRDSLLESGATVKQVSCLVPSLAPPPQTAPQHSKEGCPALANT